MKLFLFGEITNLNLELKSKFKSELQNHRNKIAYISSSPQLEIKTWFFKTHDEYKIINPEITLEYFDLSEKFSDMDLEKILDFDIIHLSGGNTFEFLNMIRKRNFHKIIDEFKAENKLILGLSAGAIILTPTIEIAKLGDENTVAMTDFTGLGYVDFEFCPHYEKDFYPNDPDLRQYLKNTKNKVYAAVDGDGIFVEDGKTELFGAIEL
jgi:dipeptidase E